MIITLNSVGQISYLYLFLVFFKKNLCILIEGYLLYNIVVVFAIHWHESSMVYMCSPFWTPFPPPSPSHLCGSSQCTSPEHPVSCVDPGLTIIPLPLFSDDPSLVGFYLITLFGTWSIATSLCLICCCCCFFLACNVVDCLHFLTFCRVCHTCPSSIILSDHQSPMF